MSPLSGAIVFLIAFPILVGLVIAMTPLGPFMIWAWGVWGW